MATGQSSANGMFHPRKEAPTENARNLAGELGVKLARASGKAAPKAPKAPISKKSQFQSTFTKWAGRSVRVGGYDSLRMKSQAVPRICAESESSVPKSPVREGPDETLVDMVTAGFADLTTQAIPEKETIVLVEDIDQTDREGEWSSLIMCSDYVEDIMEHVFNLEKKFEIKPNFLEGHQVNSRMRAVLMDWLVDIHTQYRFVTDSLFLAGKILDRFLSVTSDVSRKNLQLVGITCFFLACKYEEIYPPPMKDIIDVCDNAFTSKSVCQMEQKILVTLQFDLTSPGPALFLRRFSKAAKSDIRLHSLAKYIIELCLVDTSVADLMPSAVAAGSLAISILLLRDPLKKGWNPTIEHYTKYKMDQLRPIASRIADVVYRAQCNKELKLKAVTNKYSKGKELCRIAKIPQLEPEILQRRFSIELGWQEKLSKHSVLSSTIAKGGTSMFK